MEEIDYKNTVWNDLVTGKIILKLNFLPANILLAKWKLSLKKDNSPSEMEKARKEIFNLYLKCKEYPNAQKDIAILLKK